MTCLSALQCGLRNISKKAGFRTKLFCYNEGLPLCSKCSLKSTTLHVRIAGVIAAYVQASCADHAPQCLCPALPGRNALISSY